MKGFVVAISTPTALELVAGARKYCEEVVIAVVGDESAAVDADRAFVITCEGSRIGAVPALLQQIEQEDPDVVLVEQNTDGRYFAACIAAKLGTSVLADCSELFEENGKLCSRRMTYGGRAIKTEHPLGKVVACVGGGVFEAGAGVPCRQVDKICCGDPDGIVTTGMQKKEIRQVNLAAAKRVVGVGRGIGSEEKLAAAKELAELTGSELACTRPVSEEMHLLEKERYLGVSGKIIKPQLYLALGISGQIQHTVGVNDSGVIISVNKDKMAPIFKQSDYGIVGDLQEILPKLCDMLR